MEFRFRAAGPGLPSSATVIVEDLFPTPDTGGHIESNHRQAELLADWMYDYMTAGSCQVLIERLSQKIFK